MKKLWGIRLGELHLGHIFNYLSKKPDITLICSLYDVVRGDEKEKLEKQLTLIFKHLNPKTEIVIQSAHKIEIYDITHQLMHAITFDQLKNKVPSLSVDTTMSKISYPIMMAADILEVLKVCRKLEPNTKKIQICVGEDNQVNLEIIKTLLKKTKEKFPEWFNTFNIDPQNFIDVSYLPVINNLKNKNIKMSSSSFGTVDSEGVIYLSDTTNIIKEKIKKAVSYDLENSDIENGLYQLISLMEIDTSSMSWSIIKEDLTQKLIKLIHTIKSIMA